MDQENQALEGGRANQIFRDGDLVVRPSGDHSAAVHKLLAHLQQVGFDAAPRPYGFDGHGNERVSFVEGTVYNSLTDELSRSSSALRSAARLLRRYHDATVSFVTPATVALPWMLPVQEPSEVLCHGDFAPYNVVQQGDRVIGIFDFDTAHPAPRLWDVAYAVYRWAPLSGPQNAETFGSLKEKVGRAKLFCDAYGLDAQGRNQLAEMTISRLETMIAYMKAQAAAGDETFTAHIEEGHAQLYADDIEFIRAHLNQIREGIG